MTRRRAPSVFNLLIISVVLFSIALFFRTIFISKNNSPKIRKSPTGSSYLFESGNEIFSAKIGTKDSKSPYYIFNNRDQSSASFSLKNSSTESISRKSNSVIFNNAKPNTDFIYSTLPNGIKEEIILKTATSSADFTFTLTTSNANPRPIGTDAYSRYFFDDKNNYQFHIETPFAVDAKGVRTEDISLAIRKSAKNENTYELLLSVSPEWLSAKDRAFPVTIDPTVVHDTGSEFTAGILNRMKNTGSEASPSLETFYQELPADESTVGLWHLNESANDTCSGGEDACDSSGYGSHLTATGTVIQTTIQLLGAAARSFNGTSDFLNKTVAAGSPLDIDTNAMTMEAWIKADNVAPADNMGIIARGTAGTNGYGIAVAATTGNINLGGHGGSNFNGNTRLAANQWYHIAGVINGTDSRIYINGVLDGTGTVNVVASTADFKVGAEFNGAATYRFFDGLIDEVRVTNSAKTPEEIKLDAQRRPYSILTSSVIDLAEKVSSFNSLSWTETGVTTGDGETIFNSSSLITQWNFNNTSGTTATSDAGSCGATCDLTLTNFASTGSQDAAPLSGWTSANRRWGAGAIMTDGSNDRLSCSDANCGGAGKLDFGTGSFSLETWYFAQPAATDRMLLTKRDSSAITNAGYILHLGSGNKMNCRIGDGVNTALATSTFTYSNGLWHHVACVINRSTQTISIYVDGKLDPEATVSTSAVGSVDNAIEFVAGAFGSGGVYTLLFPGILDTARIYSRVLTAEEIMSNYNAGNIELQTRVGSDTSPDDGSWEEWRPVTNETVIDNMNNPLDYATPSATIYTGALIATSASSLPVIEGSNSLQVKLGRVTSLTNTAALWHLDETSGTGAYIKDSTTNANNGTPTALTNALGISGLGKVFDGSTSLISVPDHASLNLTTAISVSVWYKTTDTAGGLITKRSGNNGYRLVYAGGIIHWTVGNGSTVVQPNITGFNDGRWHLAVGTYDNANAKLYIDGLLVDTLALTGPMTNTATALLIGDSDDQGKLSGTIDEVRINNVVLSPEEIAEAYRLGRDHYINKTISSTDLSGKKTLPFYIAADRPGTYLETSAGESPFADYQTDANTVGLWHLGEARSGNTDIIKFVSTNTTEGNSYSYFKTVAGQSTVVATNDRFEYDVYLATSLTNTGTIDARFTDATYMRSFVACHAGDLTAVALLKWYHRTCIIPAGANGKTIDWVDLVNENDTNTTSTVYYDNIVIKDSTGAIKATLYTSGTPAFNTLDFESNAANTQTMTVSDYSAEPIVSIDQPVDDQIKDVSGANNHMTPYNTQMNDGKIGKGKRFNSSQLISNSNYNYTSESFTIDLWVRPENLTTTNVILSNGAFQVNGYYAEIVNTGAIQFITNQSGAAQITASSAIIKTGEWYHLAFVRNGTGVKIYINGQDSTLTAGTHTNPTSTTFPFLVGSYWADTTNFSYYGLIDEVRVSNTARTADEIRQTYEGGLRSHRVTIDFAASLNSGNLITGSGDLSFTVDATAFGLSFMGEKLFKGDKVIVRENVDGTEYLAQGTVTAITESTGATTVASWDTGSTFPSGGFTAGASVFKWQREYWNITEPLDVHLNATTNLTLRQTDDLEGRTIWLDDLRSNTDYLTTPGGSTITSSTGSRYFQYRAILNTFDENVSATLSAVTVDYTPNTAPGIPTLDSPANGATGVLLSPQLKTTATDADGDYLRYKIELCTNSAMTANCSTFDQTASQTGWSGQDTQGGTAYTSGTQATYTIQVALTENSTYYWRSYAIDPNGTNTFGSTQASPNSFTTNIRPNTPTLDSPLDGATGVSTTAVLRTTATDNDSDYLRYKIQICTNDAMTINCQTFDQTVSQTGWSGQNTQSGTAYTSGTQGVYTVQTPLQLSTTYFWRSYAIDPGGVNAFSTTQSTPFSFTTIAGPPPPSQCTVTKATDNSEIVVNWVDNATNEDGYQIWRVVNGGAPSQLGPNLAANTITYTDTAVSDGNSYGYLIRDFRTVDSVTYYSPFCATATTHLATGNFRFEGIQFN